MQNDKNIGIGLKCRNLVQANSLELKKWDEYLVWLEAQGNITHEDSKDDTGTAGKQIYFFERGLQHVMKTNIVIGVAVIVIQLVLAIIFW